MSSDGDDSVTHEKRGQTTSVGKSCPIISRRVLVVGAGGYIGRHTCAGLAEAGHRYTAAQRALATVTDEAAFRGGAVLAGVDLSTLAALPNLCEFDDIVLLVSGSVPATFPDSLSDEADCNLYPHAQLLARVAPHQRVIFISSGGTVYGDALQDGGSRETDELRPQSIYGLVKVMIEQTIAFYARKNGYKYVVLRPSNPIGPPRWILAEKGIKRQQGVVTNILNTVANGGVVTQIGDETILRDYFDVRDLAKSICAVVDRPDLTEVTINVGSGIGFSIPHLLEVIRSVTGSTFDVDVRPARPFDVKRSVLDVSMAREVLGWTPTIPIERSVFDTWNWFGMNA